MIYKTEDSRYVEERLSNIKSFEQYTCFLSELVERNDQMLEYWKVKEFQYAKQFQETFEESCLFKIAYNIVGYAFFEPFAKDEPVNMLVRNNPFATLDFVLYMLFSFRLKLMNICKIEEMGVIDSYSLKIAASYAERYLFFTKSDFDEFVNFRFDKYELIVQEAPKELWKTATLSQFASYMYNDLNSTPFADDTYELLPPEDPSTYIAFALFSFNSYMSSNGNGQIENYKKHIEEERLNRLRREIASEPIIISDRNIIETDAILRRLIKQNKSHMHKHFRNEDDISDCPMPWWLFIILGCLPLVLAIVLIILL